MFHGRYSFNGCSVIPKQSFVLSSVCMKQTEFVGLTGAVKFDKNGMRTGFSLDILEVSLSRGLAKVGRPPSFRVSSYLLVIVIDVGRLPAFL